MAEIMNKILEAPNLPTEVPLFLIRGAILLPKAQLSLPIFNPNHLALVANAIKTGGYIGLIQPNMISDQLFDLDDLTLFETGTLAKINEISEIEEKKLIVDIEGISRFTLLDKFDGPDGYPIATISYDQFISDTAEEIDFSMDRSRLVTALKQYFDRLEITPNWEEINKTSNQKLINALTMACPFGPSEKQALLETSNVKSQSELILTLIEMAALSSQNDGITFH